MRLALSVVCRLDPAPEVMDVTADGDHLGVKRRLRARIDHSLAGGIAEIHVNGERCAERKRAFGASGI
jgi:hypothetical protein